LNPKEEEEVFLFLTRLRLRHGPQRDGMQKLRLVFFFFFSEYIQSKKNILGTFFIFLDFLRARGEACFSSRSLCVSNL